MNEMRISEVEGDDAQVPVLPLWLGGHAYLTVTGGFGRVRGAGGKILRRFPLCGVAELARAIESAQAALTAWSDEVPAVRGAALVRTAEGLAHYRDHLAALLVEESGMDASTADAEIAGVIDHLRHPMAGEVSGVVGVMADPHRPFVGALACAASALANGAAVIVVTSATAPSPLFAFAELTARAGWPAGVFNLLHGDSGLAAAFTVAAIPVLHPAC